MHVPLAWRAVFKFLFNLLVNQATLPIPLYFAITMDDAEPKSLMAIILRQLMSYLQVNSLVWQATNIDILGLKITTLI